MVKLWVARAHVGGGCTSYRGRLLRQIETLPPKSRAELLPASPGRAIVRAPTFAVAVATSIVGPSRLAVGNVPFLAQYLAQDADADGPPNPQLWRQRDVAYRLAAMPAQSAGISIEI
jgi:hypothetical protein